jgi:TonB family protein
MHKPLWIALASAMPQVFGLPNLSGTVEDSAGPVDGAKIVLWQVETGKGVEISSSMGRFSYPTVNDGDFVFRVEKAGLSPVYGAVRLSGDNPHSVRIVMRKAKREEVGAAASLLDVPDKPTVSDKTAKAKAGERRKLVEPVYPAEEMRLRVEGTVKLSVVVLRNGTVNDLVVLSAPDANLALAALVAVREWEYSPTVLNGETVDVITTAQVHFSLH